jgi:hypothetical protein
VKTCPHCDFENIATTEICTRCGKLLKQTGIAPTTRTLEDDDNVNGAPKWGAARFTDEMSLQLDVLATSQRFLFEAIDFQTITLGRVDPRTGRTPDVDLAQSKGLELGVSRHHASMTRREGALYLIDENSANGTYLNGQRLVAEQPRILRDGDDIRMGRLVIRVSFRMAEASAK